jgi:hypothetical protein
MFFRNDFGSCTRGEVDASKVPLQEKVKNGESKKKSQSQAKATKEVKGNKDQVQAEAQEPDQLKYNYSNPPPAHCECPPISRKSFGKYGLSVHHHILDLTALAFKGIEHNHCNRDPLRPDVQIGKVPDGVGLLHRGKDAWTFIQFCQHKYEKEIAMFVQDALPGKVRFNNEGYFKEVPTIGGPVEGRWIRMQQAIRHVAQITALTAAMPVPAYLFPPVLDDDGISHRARDFFSAKGYDRATAPVGLKLPADVELVDVPVSSTKPSPISIIGSPVRTCVSFLNYLQDLDARGSNAVYDFAEEFSGGLLRQLQRLRPFVQEYQRLGLRGSLPEMWQTVYRTDWRGRDQRALFQSLLRVALAAGIAGAGVREGSGNPVVLSARGDSIFTDMM